MVLRRHNVLDAGDYDPDSHDVYRFVPAPDLSVASLVEGLEPPSVKVVVRVYRKTENPEKSE